MKYSIAALLLLMPVSVSAAIVSPAGLAPGSQYQLIFVTFGKHDAISNSIADYNDFIASQAALNSSLPPDITWSVVGSTATVDARDNAQSSGLPIYNTQGERVAATSLYGGSLFAPIRFDQFGDVAAIDVFTGSLPDGTGHHGGAPGDPLTLGTGSDRFGNAFVGRSDVTTSDWISRTISNASANPRSFYALSSPITVPVPEPSTIVLACIGIVLFSVRLVRWSMK